MAAVGAGTLSNHTCKVFYGGLNSKAVNYN